MNDDLNYQTFILISSTKLILSVYTDSNKEIYRADLKFENDSKEINFEKLDFFLDENVFKIEKKIKNFIKKISVILDSNVFFPVEISMKKNNYGDPISYQTLHHLLQEAINSCKITLSEKKIVHMLITDYLIDNKSYLILPKDIKCNYFSINLKFLSISKLLEKDLETILKKFHISLHRLVSATYLKEYSLNSEQEIFLSAKKLINGHNPNEVIFADKSKKIQGFFERFFSFFG